MMRPWKKGPVFASVVFFVLEAVKICMSSTIKGEGGVGELTGGKVMSSLKRLWR